jgi:hypothetical protein
MPSPVPTAAIGSSHAARLEPKSCLQLAAPPRSYRGSDSSVKTFRSTRATLYPQKHVSPHASSQSRAHAQTCPPTSERSATPSERTASASAGEMEAQISWKGVRLADDASELIWATGPAGAAQNRL